MTPVARRVRRPRGPLVERPVQAGTIRRIGVISYGMYIYHIFAVLVATSIVRRLPSRFPLRPVRAGPRMTAAVAELSFRLYETPFLRLKDSSRPVTPRVGPGGPAPKSEAPAA